jgi:phosphoglycerate dehydrogenase-like enzyme
MPTLQGKTMGLLGFGDIAKHTARAAKAAFGMRIITVRRNAAKSVSEQDAELVDSTLDLSSQKLHLFSQSDFVVCTLPGAPTTPPCSALHVHTPHSSSQLGESAGRRYG